MSLRFMTSALVALTCVLLSTSAFAQIRVAVAQATGSNTAGAEIVAQLNDDTYFDFQAQTVDIGGLDSATELSSYDVVILGDSGYGDFGYTEAMATAMRTELRAGRIGVVTSGWLDFNLRATTRDLILDDLIPTDTSTGSGAYCSGTIGVTIPSPSTHPVTAGVAGSFSVPNLTYAEFSNVSPDGTNAAVLGTVSSTGGSCTASQPRRAIVVGEEGVGRTVYLGLLYTGTLSDYANSALRSGDADRLFEQAVAWSSGQIVFDTDGDGVFDSGDNCPNAPNPGQADADGDDLGDACDPVPVANADNYSVDEDTALTQAAPGVLANDTDGDGDALAPSISTPPSSGTLTLAADGALTYTPNADFNGTDTFEYTVNDGTSDSAPATVTITVNPVDDAPYLVDPTPQDQAIFSVSEGTLLEFTVAGEDVDGDALTYAVTPLPSGATFDTSTGAFSWTPMWQEAGTYDLTLEVTDGTSSDTRDISVQVSFIDDDADELPDTWETDQGLDPTTPDSDNDNIADVDEVGGDLENPRDTDQDGTLDALDDDSDDDGIADIDEAGDDDLATEAVDTDQDGTPDYRDTDSDDDGVLDADDVCPLVADEGQEDADSDGLGNACDSDDDDDGIDDEIELANDMDPLSADSDGDGISDGDEFGDETDTAVDTDRDGTDDVLDDDSDDDGLPDADEAGDDDLATAPVDTDSDGEPDFVDTDSDDDTIDDGGDNCPLVENTDQSDLDSDGVGDACEDDADGDGVADPDDNCPRVANGDQADLDQDATGDECDGDVDGDEVDNAEDNCPLTENSDQADLDEDEIGDACDDDIDGDEVVDDACPTEFGEGDDGCPVTDTAGAQDGCGCASTRHDALPGSALMLLLFGGAMALLRRRESR